jgi:hypothetical protein
MEQKLKAIPNPEKKKHEKWEDDRSLIDFPRPFRWGILGAVSCGKTSLILNYLATSHKYDNIFIMHPRTYSPNVALDDELINENIIVEPKPEIPEYDGVDFIGLSYLPGQKFFNTVADKHNLFIIDDIDLISYIKRRNEMRTERLNKLFSYVSSHSNVSIIVSTQDASSQLPPFVLKMCNVTTVFKVFDEFIMQTLARKLSTPYRVLKYLMGICEDVHDSITFDNTFHSKYRYRLNIFEPIDIPENNAKTIKRTTQKSRE